MDVNDSRDSPQAGEHKDTTTRRDIVKTGATLASGLALGVYLKPAMQSAHLPVIANPSFASSPPSDGKPPTLPKPPRPSKPQKPPKPPKRGR